MVQVKRGKRGRPRPIENMTYWILYVKLHNYFHFSDQRISHFNADLNYCFKIFHEHGVA